MSKYIIELDDRIKLVTSVGVTEHGVVYTTSDYVHNLEELNSDYINEHFGELQDEAYKRGYEDGKKSTTDDRIEVGDEVIDKDGDMTIVTNIHERLFDGLCRDGSTMSDLLLEDVRKTGRHYDYIGKLLEAIRA